MLVHDHFTESSQVSDNQPLKKQTKITEMIGYDKDVIEDGNTSSDSLTDELDEEEYNDTVDMDLA